MNTPLLLLQGAGLETLAPAHAKSVTRLLDPDRYTRPEPLLYSLEKHQEVPPVDLYEFDDVLVDHNGALILAGEFLVGETCCDFPGCQDWELGALRFERAADQWSLRLPDALPSVETPCLLLLKPGFDNYGHWLVELLPKLKAALPALPADILIAVGGSKGKMREVTLHTLAALGIEPERVCPVRGVTRFRKLYYVSPLTRHGLPSYIAPYCLRFLRETFLPPAAPTNPGRRLYISRSDQAFRRLLNEHELIGMLLPLGFEVIHPGQMAFAEQIRRFSEAEWIIGVKGAGLTNIVFAPPGATLLALAPPAMFSSFYWELALLNRQRYFELRGSEFCYQGGLYADFTVAPDQLAALLEAQGWNCPPVRAENPGPPIRISDRFPAQAALALYRHEAGTLAIHWLRDGREIILAAGIPTSGEEPGLPLIGDWDGDGIPGFGIYVPRFGVFALSNRLDVGQAETSFQAQVREPMQWLPLVGDWDGDGVQTPGLYNPAQALFALTDRQDGSGFEHRFCFGAANAGWLPVTGDWDGDGRESIGLYDPRSGFFFLKNGVAGGDADLMFQFGPLDPAMIPFAGKWESSGKSSVGLYDAGQGIFHLRCEDGAALHSHRFPAGTEAAIPFAFGCTESWPKSCPDAQRSR